MRLTACLAAALLCPFAASPALAQIERDAATGIVTCSTSAGHYMRRIVTGVGEGGRISGAVRLVRPDSDPRYPAAAGFIFKEAGARNVGVQIALRPGTSDRMVYGVKMPGERPLVEVGEASASLWYPLAISIANGTVTVQIGQHVTRARVRLNGPLQPILHCNSGTFQFRLDPGLELGETPVNAVPNSPPARAPGGAAPSPSAPSR